MKIRAYILFFILIVVSTTISAQENDIYRIERLPISSKFFNDMSPVVINDGIVFCSDRRFSALFDVRTFDRTLLYNIYFSERIDTMDYGRVNTYTNDLSALANEGPFCFSPDGNQLYYTSNVKQGKNAKKKGADNKMGIFIADRTGDGWTNIRPFQHNDPLYHYAHPYISPDGSLLFFASDIPGGEGGSDIWYCEWVNGEWTSPLPLGPEVNSPEADLYPWYSPSGELYFASDRSGGLGGLDIYSTTLRFGKWKKASILPEPINSVSDDFSYIMEVGTSNGYFTSNRGRNDDIYSFTSLIRRMNSCELQVEDDFTYVFVEDNAMKFDSMPYLYEWDFDDGFKGSGREAEHTFKNPGTYTVTLTVTDLETGEIKVEDDDTLILNIERTVQPYITTLDTCFVGERVSFNAEKTNLPGWDISKYYWNFDDGTIDTGLVCEKVFTSSGTYVVQLIVTGTADQNGASSEICVSKYIVVRERQ